MLLGLLLTVPQALCSEWRLVKQQSSARAVALIILTAGLWNVFWYGTQHLDQFWGICAVASGVTMIAAASAIFYAGQRSRRLMWIISLALLGFFLLYAITIIRLNLDMPILR